MLVMPQTAAAPALPPSTPTDRLWCRCWPQGPPIRACTASTCHMAGSWRHFRTVTWRLNPPSLDESGWAGVALHPTEFGTCATATAFSRAVNLYQQDQYVINDVMNMSMTQYRLVRTFRLAGQAANIAWMPGNNAASREPLLLLTEGVHLVAIDPRTDACIAYDVISVASPVSLTAGAPRYRTTVCTASMPTRMLLWSQARAACPRCLWLMTSCRRGADCDGAGPQEVAAAGGVVGRTQVHGVHVSLWPCTKTLTVCSRRLWHWRTATRRWCLPGAVRTRSWAWAAGPARQSRASPLYVHASHHAWPLMFTQTSRLSSAFHVRGDARWTGLSRVPGAGVSTHACACIA